MAVAFQVFLCITERKSKLGCPASEISNLLDHLLVPNTQSADRGGVRPHIVVRRWLAWIEKSILQPRDSSSAAVLLEMGFIYLISTGTTMSFGPGLLQMQQEECPLAELGNGSCTEGGLIGISDEDG